MRIVSLAPFLTELVAHFECADQLVGISHQCDYPAELSGLPRCTAAGGQRTAHGGKPLLSTNATNLESVRALAPTLLITSTGTEPRAIGDEPAWQAQVKTLLGEECRALMFNPLTLDDVFATYERLATALAVAEKGRALVQRQRAQFSDWCDNFYDRTKNKKVTVLASIEPLRVAGGWVSDMVRLTSAHPQLNSSSATRAANWQEILDFRPDVLVVAPEGMSSAESFAVFPFFEKQPNWEDLPAAKRGEVYFTSGHGYLHQPGPRLTESMARLITAIAGLESGYVCERDSIQRLRYLELHRHKFLTTK